MTVKKSGLGRGLGALLSIYDEEVENVASDAEKTKEIKEDKAKNDFNAIIEIDIQKIIPNPNQPRKAFDEDSLNELANSIRVHGVIQPIVVNKSDDTFMIIAGERRWRASKIAGLSVIPCIIKNYTERQVKEIAIIENLQREDLNPIEAARAIKQLMEEYNFTQEIVSDRIGISRSTIANTLRLLSLCPDVLTLVEADRLSAGHARCLVVLNDFGIQVKMANMACDNKMTVRDLEKMVKNYLKPKDDLKDKPEQSMELKELLNEMQRTFSTKVSAIGNDKKGRIYIDYYSRDDLDRICELIELLKSKTLTLKDLSEFNKRNK